MLPSCRNSPALCASSFSPAERGQAATEVVLSLPFFVLVMLLGVNFGKASLLQHKAVIAARYAAWHDARTQRPISRSEMQRAGYGGQQMRLTSVSSGDGRLAAGYALGGGIQAVTAGLSSVLTSAYDSLLETPKKAYTVSYRWRPLGRVLPEAQPSGAHTVSLEDWRHGREESWYSDFMDDLRSKTRELIKWVGF